MKQTYYLDTSIWNFYYAEDTPDFQKATVEFLRNLDDSKEEIFISQVVLDEISAAPEIKRVKLERLITQRKPTFLELHQEIEELALRYIEEGVLRETDYADALHIAIASVYEVEYLLSWNFRHIANIPKSEKVNAVNLLSGYVKELKITTPLGVREND